MELEFATTEELVMELVRRPTFVGAVMHSTTEHRSPTTEHDHFQICTNLVGDDLESLLLKCTAAVVRGDVQHRTQ